MCAQNTVLLEAVLFFYGDAFFVGEAFQIGLPAGAEVDVEPPEPPDEGLGVLVVLGTDFTVCTGHGNSLFICKIHFPISHADPDLRQGDV